MSAPGGLKGSLDQASLPEILRPLVRAKKTGLLRVGRGKVTKTVYLLEGRLIFATSGDPDDRLGEMLLRRGRITYQALEESVRALHAGKRQGTLLVENGAIRSRDLIDGVTEQVQEIIYSLFHWDEGQFEFVEGDLPSREVIVLRMSTGDLLREGVRRVERWSRIRRGVGELSQRYALSAESAALLPALSLEPDEVSLVATLDGVTSLEEICRGSRLPDFVVCRNLWGLWAAGIMDRVPQDTGPDSPRAEKTEPHAERMTGASVGREIDRFNQLHRFLHELVHYQLRDEATTFFERAFAAVSREHAQLFEGVAVDGNGELDPIGLRRNIVTYEIARYLQGLDRLLAIESELVLELMGERKAAIIEDGLLAIKQQQLEGKPAR
jgi:uncharacterized protein DUF4388